MTRKTPSHKDGMQGTSKAADQSWESWIDELIREAQDRGEFDNLRGRGKPLPLRRNPMLAQEQQLAYDLLQNSGHTLPWIDDAKAIDVRLAAIRDKLRHDFAWYQEERTHASTETSAKLEAIWQRTLQDLRHEIEALNRLIDTYNLKAPSPHFHKFRLRFHEELARVQGDQER